MSVASATRRILRSPLVDMLVGPHGVDRYLELIRPDLTVSDARAQVVAVRRQTPRSVTLTLRPNAAWSGFRAGQFVRVGVEIDGVRRTRTYSPASSAPASSGERADRTFELTVTVHPDGLVSRHMRASLQPGTIVHLGPAQGDFVLPDPAPEALVLVSGGSGITPVMSMLRTLCDEGHRGEIVFMHYARIAEDWLYQAEVQELAARHPNLNVVYVATRQGGRHMALDDVLANLGTRAAASAYAAVCGPPTLIDAVSEIWTALQGSAQRVLAETFTPPSATVVREATEGTLRFLDSAKEVATKEGTLLEQAEAAGLTPDFGCRMGICHTCTCRKAAGAVRNVLTGEVSEEEHEDIQLCVSVPVGDVALNL